MSSENIYSKAPRSNANQNLALKQRAIIYFGRFLGVCGILSAIFDSYKSPIPGISFSEFILILACILFLIAKRGNLFINRLYLPFAVYFIAAVVLTAIDFLVLNTSFSVVSFEELITRIIRYGAHTVFILFLCSNIESNYILKVYRTLCLVASLYIIAQAVFFYSFHIILPWKLIPFLDYSRSYDTDLMLLTSVKYYFRAYGFFAEPGYAAVFILPGLAISFLRWQKLGGFPWSTAITFLALMLTTSLQGIVVGVITLAVMLIIPEKSERGSRDFLKLSGFAIGLLLLLALLIVSGIISFPIERIASIASTSQGNSIGMRVYRGFAVWSDLPTFAKLFGVGLGNVGNSIVDFGIVTPYDSMFSNSTTAIEYVNGISSIMITTGLIGLSIFILWLVKICYASSYVGKLVIMQLIALLFVGGGIFSMHSVFMLCIAYLATDAYSAYFERCNDHDWTGERNVRP